VHVLEWVSTGALLGGEVLVHGESWAAHRELSCKRLLGEATAEEAVVERDDALELPGWQDTRGGGRLGGGSATPVVDRPRLPDKVGQARERAHPLARLPPLVHRPHVAQEAREEELGEPERTGEVGAKALEFGGLLAALVVHLELLQWARAQTPRAPWDEGTCSQADLGGHLELLQWARDNGAPWNERPCTNAAMHGDLELLQWAHASGAPWRYSLVHHFAAAGSASNPELLQCVIEQGEWAP